MENVNSCCYVARINEIKPIPGADNIEQAIVVYPFSALIGDRQN